jgi:hypothetical protein
MPEVNGTTYDDASPQVIAILERCREDGTRIRVAYGMADGQDTGEWWNTVGYVSRSMGPMKIPLLIFNRRAIGGYAITADRVVRIETTKGRRLLYQHPAYKPPKEVTDAMPPM